ncbi:MAG TPA: YtxH domain-containing protein [Ignavibacteriaceae bacterium]|nr:YtxH domain-containing protein [Ignavibacteriaceae bacterium]
MSHENNFSKGLLIGLLTGGAIGAVLALLYAPKSGRELRNDIRLKADDYLDDAERYITEAKDKAIDLINEGKRKSDRLIKDAKDKSDLLLKDAEKMFKDAKSKAGDYLESGKESIDHKRDQIKSAIKAGVDAYKETKKEE